MELILLEKVKNLGDLGYRRGQYDAAQESYLRAIKANPQLGEDVYLKLGNIRYRHVGELTPQVMERTIMPLIARLAGS